MCHFSWVILWQFYFIFLIYVTVIVDVALEAKDYGDSARGSPKRAVFLFIMMVMAVVYLRIASLVISSDVFMLKLCY
jgi:hypothetical protein